MKALINQHTAAVCPYCFSSFESFSEHMKMCDQQPVQFTSSIRDDIVKLITDLDNRVMALEERVEK